MKYLSRASRAKTGRRTFLRSAGVTAGAFLSMPTASSALLGRAAPSDVIGVGCIGLGTRGGDLINEVVQIPGVQVVAVCDVYAPHVEKGVQRSQNPDVRRHVDYRDVLADPGVDAVVIATPDHWHAPMVVDAAAAGKDIYCEKGWGRTIADAKEMRGAVRQAGIVFQLGHQARQATCALQARELIARGALGPITRVRTGRCMNSPLGRNIWRWYGHYSQWDRPDPAQVEREVDWDRWLGPAPKIPFHEERFWHWRCYWDYGTGQAGDLLSHEMDFVQYLLGYGVPDSCACAGLNALLRDGREVPDTWNATYHFESRGCTVTFDGSMNTGVGQPVEICGKEATLRFDGIAHDATSFAILPESFTPQGRLPRGYQEGQTPIQPSHMQDFFDCVRSRGVPKCGIDEAFIETVTCVMSVEAYRQQRLVRWDPTQETIV